MWNKVARWYIFKPKIPIWVNLVCLGMEKVVLFFGHLEYIISILVHFMAVWWFGCNLVYFALFWYIVSSRIWQPGRGMKKNERRNFWFPLLTNLCHASFSSLTLISNHWERCYNFLIFSTKNCASDSDFDSARLWHWYLRKTPFFRRKLWS
jgi:hypothetical protein